jgi:hypothetical protein
MRTVRGIPNCRLPNGRRFPATVTYTCEDEDAPYVESTFVDIAPGRLDVFFRPHDGFTTVFSVRVTADERQPFPRFRAWLAMIGGRPFSVLPNDVAMVDACLNLRVRGYFDARLQIHFNESHISDAVAQFALGKANACTTGDGPLSMHAATNPTDGSVGNGRIHHGQGTVATQ